ncbi:MAG: RHS domain-containing protein [Xanthomonadales bacterium]|nr:RHS domain-containing protein [Xanthomonadales bacterium]
MENEYQIWSHKPIALVRTVYSGGVTSSVDIYYILTDHLNTPRKVTNSTGTVLWSWQSNAFGSTPADMDVDGDGTNFQFNLRFPGQFFDTESGQHYNYFRDYEPATGRYLESDPIGLRGDWNTYLYVGGNPLSSIDLLGLCSIKVCESSGYLPSYPNTLTCLKWRFRSCYKDKSCSAKCQKFKRICIDNLWLYDALDFFTGGKYTLPLSEIINDEKNQASDACGRMALNCLKNCPDCEIDGSTINL